MTGQTTPHALLRPRVAIPFLLVALIWGSTWWVITGQISDVPAQWSVAYRFMLAAPAMFAVALLSGKCLKLARSGHMLAVILGLFQFSANYNLVYLSELHLTSGIVAVMFSIIILPNSLLAAAFLGQKVTRRFLAGSAIALVGIAMLLAYEARLSPLGGNVPLGIFLGIAAMLAASVANIVQATPPARSLPMLSLLAWGMLYGAIFDTLLALAIAGPPVLPAGLDFWLGMVWLALAGSVLTFPLYFGLIREIGAGRAGYNGVAVVVIAMVFSTLLEGYDWSSLALGGAMLSTIGMVIALRAKSI